MSESDDTKFGTELLLSLPAMSASDWQDAQRDWKAVSGTATETAATVEQEYLQRTCSSTQEQQHNDDKMNNWTPLMQQVYTQLQDYQSERYKASKMTRRLTLQPVVDDDNNHNNNNMIVRTYLEILDAANCQTGRLAVEWHIQPVLSSDDKTETTAHVSGTAQLHVHYYENDTNIQLVATQTFQQAPASTAEEKVNSIVAQMEERQLSYEVKVARAVVAQIRHHEDQLVQTLLHTTFASANCHRHLKSLRRILPITKTRFPWNAAAHKQVQLLQHATTAQKEEK